MTNSRKPTTPGEILKEEFLAPLEMTQKQLADHLSVDIKVINRIVNGRSGVSPTLALKLAHAFNTTPNFWLNAQTAVDLYEARKSLKKPPKRLVG
jgi:addiction module HigA family antidote